MLDVSPNPVTDSILINELRTLKSLQAADGADLSWPEILRLKSAAEAHWTEAQQLIARSAYRWWKQREELMVAEGNTHQQQLNRVWKTIAWMGAVETAISAFVEGFEFMEIQATLIVKGWVSYQSCRPGELADWTELVDHGWTLQAVQRYMEQHPNPKVGPHLVNVLIDAYVADRRQAESSDPSSHPQGDTP